MVLIPKEHRVDVIEKFWPIVLGIFFKVITKILANRLAVFASRIVDPH